MCADSKNAWSFYVHTFLQSLSISIHTYYSAPCLRFPKFPKFSQVGSFQFVYVPKHSSPVSCWPTGIYAETAGVCWPSSRWLLRTTGTCWLACCCNTLVCSYLLSFAKNAGICSPSSGCLLRSSVTCWLVCCQDLWATTYLLASVFYLHLLTVHLVHCWCPQVMTNCLSQYSTLTGTLLQVLSLALLCSIDSSVLCGLLDIPLFSPLFGFNKLCEFLWSVSWCAFVEFHSRPFLPGI